VWGARRILSVRSVKEVVSIRSGILGIFWYRNEEDFERLRSQSEDGAKPNDSYAEWLTAAEAVVERLKDGASGVKAVRVDVDPDQFLTWCAERGLKINSASRMGFASDKVYWSFRNKTDE
jgi:hypothetical protein